MRFARISPLFILFLLSALSVFGQSPNGNINGLVLDTTNRLIVGADVVAVNDVTGVQYTTKSNDAGVYVLPNLPPGPYRLQVSKSGFKTIVKPDVVLSVQDALSVNFTLPVGAAMEVVTVGGGVPLVDTESAAVSTVVDRQFAENLPMNGRSFQTLIELTPGVVATPTTALDSGQFSVNGQRTTSNYWTIDGVSANFGIGPIALPGNGSAGSVPAFSVLGGTNSLVSVDAMQEFRIQTSTYAPEFGRSPGAQISVATRSGTNRLHGTVFDYLRNDIFDANNWFNGYTNPSPLPKAKERQNDFGGTLGGPIRKNQTFFFFSYEGLRLRLPQTTLSTVPDTDSVAGGLNARENAIAALRPYLDSYPLPNGPEVFSQCNPASDPSCPATGQRPTGAAQFNASYSNPATLNAYSLRVDHKLGDRWALFGRYAYSPSSLDQRGAGVSLNTATRTSITTQTATAAVVWTISHNLINDFRFNYSRASAHSANRLDDFGGAVPLSSPPFPSGYDVNNAKFEFVIGALTNGGLGSGRGSASVQRQINVIDNLSSQVGSHSLKFGLDLRRLSPLYQPAQYFQEAFFDTMSAAETGNLFFGFLTSSKVSALRFLNLGAFAQDTWLLHPNLTITYGLRWDVDNAPTALRGPAPLAVTGYNLAALSTLALAPDGSPQFATTYGNFAPRIGIAYQVPGNPRWQTVVRGGFGVFYDLATSQVGNMLQTSYPFGAQTFLFGGNFPLDPTTAAPPPITAANLSSQGTLFSTDPHLKLPYTLEWNAAVEQAIGQQQSITASYLGSAGRRLLQSVYLLAPNPSFGSADLVGNSGTSSYHALQLQFQKRLSNGLQALASYTWSHSIDTGSAGSYGNSSNLLVPGTSAEANRGPSDFDIRHALSLGLTYNIPAPKWRSVPGAVLRDWSLQSFILARSAPPESIFYSVLVNPRINGAETNIRPDIVPSQPLYLYGPQYPGGKAFNPAAFAPPPLDAARNPLRQGNLGRNALRGFGASQWDLAIHREFPVRDLFRWEFRAEMFNVLNHPNFGPPAPSLDLPRFGVANQMLGQSLGGIAGVGGFNSLYQVGGPRSMQFALKLMF